MTPEEIFDVMIEHRRTEGMAVSMGVTCRCGYWTGSDDQIARRSSGDGLQWHRANVLAEMVAKAIDQSSVFEVTRDSLLDVIEASFTYLNAANPGVVKPGDGLLVTRPTSETLADLHVGVVLDLVDVAAENMGPSAIVMYLPAADEPAVVA